MPRAHNATTSTTAGTHLRRAHRWSAAVAVGLLLASCGTAADTDTSTTVGDDHQDASGLPSPHVHGVAINPGDDLVYLATHDGLFRYDDTGPTRIGPVIDLMGFTVAGPNHFYASGHPGEGSDLPNPVGLITSTDAGQTWTPLSRQGQSDFHALTTSPAGILGNDGTLRASPDGQQWTDLQIPLPPSALAARSDGRTVLAATDAGLFRSDRRRSNLGPSHRGSTTEGVGLGGRWHRGRRHLRRCRLRQHRYRAHLATPRPNPAPAGHLRRRRSRAGAGGHRR